MHAVKPMRARLLSLGGDFIASDSHRPLRIPTRHILAVRNREVKTFPKSTYATRDAGIPVESQKESAAAAKNPEFFSRNASGLETDSQKVGKDSAVNVFFECRHPLNLKLARLDPAQLTEFRLFRCGFDI